MYGGMGRSTLVSWVSPSPGAKPVKVRQPPWVPAVVPLAIVGAVVVLGVLLLRPSALTATHTDVTTTTTSSSSTPPAVPVAQATAADVQTRLSPAAAAWVLQPSAPAYDALAGAAAAILADPRPLAGGDTTRSLLQQLVTYPGSDEQVKAILTQLGMAKAPATTTTG